MGSVPDFPIRLTAGHQAKVEEKPEVRKAGGVYYTPTYIVDYIVKNTVGRLVEGKTTAEEPTRASRVACYCKRRQHMRASSFILFAFLLSSAAVAMTPVEIKREYGNAVVTITTYSAAEDAIGLGSGFVVDPSGVIVTCYHVIDGAYPAVVKLLNGASFQDIWVLGCDSTKDVAVIRVKGRDLPTVKLGSSDDVEVGERVVAIGNPKGLENTISDGLLSGIRETEGYSLLQISAPISPGSSGGPVFNSSGRVVGIAAATMRDGQNLNFCVPIKYAQQFTGAEPNLTLEDFSRGIRGPGPRPTGKRPVSGQHAFLVACIDPITDFCDARWHVIRTASDGNRAQFPTEVLYAKEKMLSVRRRLDRLTAADPSLSLARDALVDAAQNVADGYDMVIRGVAGKNEYAIQAGGTQAQVALNDALAPGGPMGSFARAYLDDGWTPSDTATRLPAAFDRLPAVFVTAVAYEATQDSSLFQLLDIVRSSFVKQFGFEFNQYLPGVVVESAISGTPARRAGLRRDDVIVAVSDTLPVHSLWDWWTFLARQPVGTPFSLDILRAGQKMRLSGTLVYKSQ